MFSREPKSVAVVLAIAAALSAVVVNTAESQTHRTEDPVIRAMWEQGMEQSQTEPLAQHLIDFVGPRLTGTQGFYEAVEWLESTYGEWGVDVRRDQYGTWRGWRQGILHVDLVGPRVQSLEAELHAWSPGTDGPIEGEVVTVPEFGSADEASAWLPSVAGKFVLVSAPQVTCREPQALQRLAREETYERIQEDNLALQQSWGRRMGALGGGQAHRRLEDAGAIGVLASRWSGGWGCEQDLRRQHRVGCIHRPELRGQRTPSPPGRKRSGSHDPCGGRRRVPG